MTYCDYFIPESLFWLVHVFSSYGAHDYFSLFDDSNIVLFLNVNTFRLWEKLHNILERNTTLIHLILAQKWNPLCMWQR